ncbi:MAG: helix-turn-helix domain-containing protein [Thermoflavifilum sp.]|nr:helix-turn-helix domain-containing protein [Thermoflavifilum sp.]
MEEITHFDTIHEYNVFNNNKTLHPLVSVVHLDKAAPRHNRRMRFGFYAIFLKKIYCGDLRYGLGKYDYSEGTLVFIAPGQVIGQYSEDIYQPQGIALVFHHDLLIGTSLAKNIHQYHFFSYAVNEALHLSEKEKEIVLDCFSKIEYELEHPIDKHSKELIVSNIELFLHYCQRFYDRQFITREQVNKGILTRFEELLNNYLLSEKADENELPSVSYFARELHLSANYFSDLIKRETGKSAMEYIQNKIIDIAKEKLFDNNKSIQEIAFELGFKYPQHFTRFFKRRVGYSPKEFRLLGK